MGLGRFAGAACLVATASALSGCAVTVGPVVERGVLNSPNSAAGVRVEAVVHPLSHAANGFAAGVRIDHLAQFNPAVTYDRSRYELLFGYSIVPRGFAERVGLDAFGTIGGERGAMGGIESTPVAFTTGIALGAPIRLTPVRYGADEVLRLTIMLVPQVDFRFAAPIEGAYQLQLTGGLGFRVYLDSSLLP